MMRMQPITHTKQCKRMILVLDCMWGSISIPCNLLLIKWTMRSMEISTWSPWKPVKLNFLVWNKCFELLGYQCRVKEIYITDCSPSLRNSPWNGERAFKPRGFTKNINKRRLSERHYHIRKELMDGKWKNLHWNSFLVVGILSLLVGFV